MKLRKIFSVIVAVIILFAGNVDAADKKSDAKPVKKSVAEYAAQAKGIYTGLIVDCRGLKLKSIMSPVIINSKGTPIYGHKNLDDEKIITQGLVAYIKNFDDAKRAGDNPLVVKAVRLEYDNTTPVLNLADSNRVLIENYATKFLKDLKVVFLFD